MTGLSSTMRIRMSRPLDPPEKGCPKRAPPRNRGERTRGPRETHDRREVLHGGSQLGLVVEGEFEEGVGSLEAELLADGGALVLDRPVVNTERRADLLARFRFCDQLQDLAVTVGEHG